jgi:pimeloyl-ACP methyl ester carboxylesterase
LNYKTILVRLILFVLTLIILILVYGRARLLWTETQTVQQAAPTTGRWVKAHDINMYVQEFGNKDAPPLVLVHGTGAWSGTWVSNVEAMTQSGFRVFALDLPPFGYSETPTSPKYSRLDQAQRILGAIESLGLRQVVLLGHSFGGGPATEAAMRAQGQVRALILVDAALGTISAAAENCTAPGFPVSALGLRPLRTALMGAFITEPIFSKTLLGKFVARKEVVTDWRVGLYQQPFNVDHYTENLGDWAYAFATGCESPLSANEREYKKLTMPVKLLWGNLDSITPLAQAERAQKLLPNASLHLMQGVGHIPQIEDIALFNTTLQGALQSLTEVK